jgi:predicted XRE-type DNA-binding protein
MPTGKHINRKPETSTKSVLSSGNVFADLQLANPELALAKAELVLRIQQILDKRRLTQAQAAKMLGLDQPKVSALVRGRVEGYSLDRLFRFLNVLGQDVEITLRAVPSTKKDGRRAGILVTS